MNILFGIGILFYIVYTFLFTVKFNRSNPFYSGKQKNIHIILIWIIPFLWIILLKTLIKPTLGSQHYEKKITPPSTSYSDLVP